MKRSEEQKERYKIAARERRKRQKELEETQKRKKEKEALRLRNLRARKKREAVAREELMERPNNTMNSIEGEDPPPPPPINTTRAARAAAMKKLRDTMAEPDENRTTVASAGGVDNDDFQDALQEHTDLQPQLGVPAPLGTLQPLGASAPNRNDQQRESLSAQQQIWSSPCTKTKMAPAGRPPTVPRNRPPSSNHSYNSRSPPRVGISVLPNGSPYARSTPPPAPMQSPFGGFGVQSPYTNLSPSMLPLSYHGNGSPSPGQQSRSSDNIMALLKDSTDPDDKKQLLGLLQESLDSEREERSESMRQHSESMRLSHAVAYGASVFAHPSHAPSPSGSQPGLSMVPPHQEVPTAYGALPGNYTGIPAQPNSGRFGMLEIPPSGGQGGDGASYGASTTDMDSGNSAGLDAHATESRGDNENIHGDVMQYSPRAHAQPNTSAPSPPSNAKQIGPFQGKESPPESLQKKPAARDSFHDQQRGAAASGDFTDQAPVRGNLFGHANQAVEVSAFLAQKPAGYLQTVIGDMAQKMENTGVLANLIAEANRGRDKENPPRPYFEYPPAFGIVTSKLTGSCIPDLLARCRSQVGVESTTESDETFLFLEDEEDSNLHFTFATALGDNVCKKISFAVECTILDDKNSEDEHILQLIPSSLEFAGAPLKNLARALVDHNGMVKLQLNTHMHCGTGPLPIAAADLSLIVNGACNGTVDTICYSKFSLTKEQQAASNVGHDAAHNITTFFDRCVFQGSGDDLFQRSSSKPRQLQFTGTHPDLDVLVGAVNDGSVASIVFDGVEVKKNTVRTWIRLVEICKEKGCDIKLFNMTHELLSEDAFLAAVSIKDVDERSKQLKRMRIKLGQIQYTFAQLDMPDAFSQKFSGENTFEEDCSDDGPTYRICWVCDKCSTMNDGAATNCGRCQTRNPAPTIIAAPPTSAPTDNSGTEVAVAGSDSASTDATKAIAPGSIGRGGFHFPVAASTIDNDNTALSSTSVPFVFGAAATESADASMTPSKRGTDQESKETPARRKKKAKTAPQPLSTPRRSSRLKK